MDIKEQVEYCLQNFPHTRNSDAQLTFRIIHTFLPSDAKQIDGVWWFSSKALQSVKEDVVKRYRAKFNEQGKYLPTSEKVFKLRKLNREWWHQEMSPSNPTRG